eukprot:SAG11_NODE_659_length_7895_cov_18.189969_6_plen_210_part_00
MLELGILVSLTYDGQLSWASRFCRSKAMQWLGDISMSFYMIHMMLLFAVGAAFYEEDEDAPDLCMSDALAEYRTPDEVFQCCLSPLNDGCDTLGEEDPDFDCTECECPMRVLNDLFWLGFYLVMRRGSAGRSLARVNAGLMSRIMPLSLSYYMIPVVMLLSIMAGWGLTRCIAEPCEKKIRSGDYTWNFKCIFGCWCCRPKTYRRIDEI